MQSAGTNGFTSLAHEEATRALASRLERFAFIELHHHADPLRWMAAIETRNRYLVCDPYGGTLGWAAEEGEGLGGFPRLHGVARWRPFDVALFDDAHRLAFRAAHPARWLRTRLDVDGGDGLALGAVQQRFSISRKVIDVLDTDGRTLLTARARPFPARRFDFERAGGDVAAVEDRSQRARSGYAKRRFAVSFGDALGGKDRLLVLAAALLVRVKYFDDGARR